MIPKAELAELLRTLTEAVYDYEHNNVPRDHHGLERAMRKAKELEYRLERESIDED